MILVDLLFTDAVVHLPEGEAVEGWLAVRDGFIDAVGDGAPPPARQLVRCEGGWLLPGLVDAHVHFRDPGFPWKETFTTGSAAAAAGGVTTVVDMPNTGSLVVSPDDLAGKRDRVSGRSYVDFGLYALLVDSAPYVEELCALGAAGFKWLLGYDTLEGRPAQPGDKRSLLASLAAAAEQGLLIGVHAEKVDWIEALEAGLHAEGRRDPRAHGESRPPFVEALAIAEAAVLAAEAGCRLHVHHLSSRAGLETALALRGSVCTTLTIETCPHYLFLTEGDLDRLGTCGRVNPPLRHGEDAAALSAALAEGQVDCVASDHAPHAPEEKQTASVWEALSGLIGVETMLPLLLSSVLAGELPVRRLVEASSQTPADIVGFGDRKGRLLPGYDADIVVVDPTGRTTITPTALHSLHRSTPFENRECLGAIRRVFLRGGLVVADGRIVGGQHGRYVPARYSRSARAIPPAAGPVPAGSDTRRRGAT